MTLYVINKALTGVYARLEDPQVQAALDPALDVWNNSDDWMKNALGDLGWDLALMVGCRDIEMPEAFFDDQMLARYDRMLNRASRLGLATLTKKMGRVVRAEVYFERIITNPTRYQKRKRFETLLAYDELLTENGFPDEPIEVRLNPEIKTLADIHRWRFQGIGS
jgi:hypothetical protein